MKIELHASNLINPTHMEWTNDDKLLVSEHTKGIVTEITNGGDMKDSKPFATGLKGPSGILPTTDGKILVAETWGGTVKDISDGGEMSSKDPFAFGLSMPYSLLERKKGEDQAIFVSQSYNGRNSWIEEITNGGDSKSENFYVSEIPAIPGLPGLTPINKWPNDWQKYAAGGCVINWQGGGDTRYSTEHYFAHSGLGQIFDISENSGDYFKLLSEKKAVAWGMNKLGAIHMHPKNGLLYCVEPEQGNIVAINPKSPQNHKFTPAVVKNLVRPTCLRFDKSGETMYVCGTGEGVIWKITGFMGTKSHLEEMERLMK